MYATTPQPKIEAPAEILLFVAGQEAAAQLAVQDDCQNFEYSCVTSSPVSPGERIPCRIALSRGKLRERREQSYVEGTAEVVRVSLTGRGFRLGCRISSMQGLT